MEEEGLFSQGWGDSSNILAYRLGNGKWNDIGKKNQNAGEESQPLERNTCPNVLRLRGGKESGQSKGKFT